LDSYARERSDRGRCVAPSRAHSGKDRVARVPLPPAKAEHRRRSHELPSLAWAIDRRASGTIECAPGPGTREVRFSHDRVVADCSLGGSAIVMYARPSGRAGGKRGRQSSPRLRPRQVKEEELWRLSSDHVQIRDRAAALTRYPSHSRLPLVTGPRCRDRASLGIRAAERGGSGG
jgi:hypothetical protein